MDMAMAGFAAYVLLQVETGVRLYQTFATPTEIAEANASLESYGNSCRFVPVNSPPHDCP